MIQHNYVKSNNKRKIPLLTTELWFNRLLKTIVENEPVAVPSFGVTLPANPTCEQEEAWIRYKATDVIRNKLVIDMFGRQNLSELSKKNGTRAYINFYQDSTDGRNTNFDLELGSCTNCSATRVFVIYLSVCEAEAGSIAEPMGEVLAKKITEILLDNFKYNNNIIKVTTGENLILGFVPRMVTVDNPFGISEPQNENQNIPNYYTTVLTLAIPVVSYSDMSTDNICND